jgi:hypothetical protein
MAKLVKLPAYVVADLVAAAGYGDATVTKYRKKGTAIVSVARSSLRTSIADAKERGNGPQALEASMYLMGRA